MLSVVAILLGIQAYCLADNSFPITRRIEDIEAQVDDFLSYRLPNNTVPISYDISFLTRVDINDFNFTGTVRIGIITREASNSITLHHRQLTIVSAELWTTDPTPMPIQVSDPIYLLETELLTIPVLITMPNNTEYTVVITYSGILRTDNEGLYRSSYVIDNQRRWLATTQFESTNARHGFPCYDEPALKATFKIRISHGSTYTALSNMPPVGAPVAHTNGTSTTEFEVTPRTSTYLIAFIISDFQYISNAQNSSIPHRAISRPNALGLNNLILEAGEKILDAIADYVSVNFTLPKMDQVAIPDFNAGAMENWGIVTYREERLFWDESVNTHTYKTGLITLIAHEFGHQWFGNLVGPSWWTYIWLNEGFANLFEHIGVDLVYPEWKILDLYVLDTIQNVMWSDSLESTRPMSLYAESPAAVSALFDIIAYAKSGSVLRMFKHALTESSFKKGLTIYFNAKKFSDASEGDLFDALNRAAHEDNTLSANLNVNTIFSSWSNQKGYPLLKVTRDYVTGEITLNQERYLHFWALFSTVQDPSIFHIPYNFLTPNSSDFSNTKADFWFSTRTERLAANVASVAADEFILFNNRETGYYRVQYDNQNYLLIADALNSDQLSNIHIVTRAQLIDDAFNFVQSNRLSYHHYLHIIRYLKNETEYVPWGAAIKGISDLNRLYAGNEKYYRFTDFVSTRIEALIRELGVNDIPSEPHQRKYARALAIKWACRTNTEYCIAESNKRLAELLSNGNEFHQNVRGELYCAALRKNTVESFYAVWQRLLTSTDAAYRNQLFTALGCTQNEDSLVAYLNSSLNSTNTKNIHYNSDEHVRIFNAVYKSSNLGLHKALQFLIVHIDEAHERYGSLNLITDIAPLIVSAELRADFKILIPLIASKGFATNESIITARQTVLRNYAWAKSNSDLISTWLDENHSSSGIRYSWSTMVIITLLSVLIKIFI